MGFSKDGPAGSFSYSRSVTRDIRDWRALNNSSIANNQSAFQFISSNPFDGLAFATGTVNTDDLSDGKGYPAMPNDLARNTMQFVTQSLFKTDSVVNEEVRIGAHHTQSLGDVACKNEFGVFCLAVNYEPWTAVDTSAGFNINLGAVLPVGLKSLTFAPNPVKAGQNVTGTLTLASPAQTDITLEIKSESEYVTPAQTNYTIPKGATSLDFTVQTSSNGTSNPFGAKISVVYGTGISAILTVNP